MLGFEAEVRRAGLRVDFAHVVDPAQSWYLQDPAGAWQGAAYFRRQLSDICAPYAKVRAVDPAGSSSGVAGVLPGLCSTYVM